MTPAIHVATAARIDFRIHPYQHDAQRRALGLEASEKLGVAPQRVFKTLMVQSGDHKLAVALVPVAQQLDLKNMAKALGVKKIQMADKAVAERVTGYVAGGISALGQKKLLPTVIDESARQFSTLYISAGRRGLEIELSAQDLARLTRAQFAYIVRIG